MLSSIVFGQLCAEPLSLCMQEPKDFNFLPLDNKLKKACREFNLVDPMILLIGRANGVDLSNQSAIYQRILLLEEEYTDAPPDPLDWLDLVAMIKDEFRYSPIPTSEAANAQKELAQYMHNKKKSVEFTDTNAEVVIVPDLTTKEAKRFKKAFNDEF